MPDAYDTILKELSAAQTSRRDEEVAEVCRRALRESVVQDRPERVFKFGMTLACRLLAHDEPVTSEEVEEGLRVLQYVLDHTPRQSGAKRWAHVHLQLGGAYSHRNSGDIGENLKASIAHFEHALSVFGKNESPKDWAIAKVAVAEAYWQIGGDRERRTAIAYTEEALAVFTRDKFPEDHDIYSGALSFMRHLLERDPGSVDSE